MKDILVEFDVRESLAFGEHMLNVRHELQAKLPLCICSECGLDHKGTGSECSLSSNSVEQCVARRVLAYFDAACTSEIIKAIKDRVLTNEVVGKKVPKRDGLLIR
jgi:hypothetical protein